jgi:hypothetical protein
METFFTAFLLQDWHKIVGGITKTDVTIMRQYDYILLRQIFYIELYGYFIIFIG